MSVTRRLVTNYLKSYLICSINNISSLRGHQYVIGVHFVESFLKFWPPLERYVERGNPGHLNDAQKVGLMQHIGTDLPFPTGVCTVSR